MLHPPFSLPFHLKALPKADRPIPEVFTRPSLPSFLAHQTTAPSAIVVEKQAEESPTEATRRGPENTPSRKRTDKEGDAPGRDGRVL